MELNELKTTESQLPVIYTAVGWVAGTYQPSEENCHRGVLLTEDEQAIPAELFWRLLRQLKRKHPDYATQSDFFQEAARWTVYPQTDPLSFRLVTMKPLHSASSDKTDAGAETGEKRPLDQFRMVGEIESVAGGTVNIRIRRNEKLHRGKSDDPEYQPFTLTLVGSLPTEAIGQIWELEVRRQGQKLVVITGQPYEPSNEDLAWLEQQKRLSVVEKPIKSSSKAVAAHVALSPSPTVEPKPPVAAFNAQLASPTVTPAAETSITPSNPAADPVADINPTSGKMEVVVKLNQFPNDVRTVDKGWKEFEVNTGSPIVTITVKPKMFASLLQAQQTYPLWIAAISGQMGASTATGFRLESPALKVFERKPKDSEQPSQTTSLKSSLQGPTPGKMEVVVKLNQFPNEVRTVDSSWKEFIVDTGSSVVTITVKTKAFALLEQAEQNYSLWVAAISGQMGVTTATGFRLESPAIKVFERKASDSSQPEQTADKDNPAPQAKESQPSLPGKTLTQQQAAQPKAESQQQPVSTKNPMQRVKEHLKQQRPTQTPKTLGQKQQRDQVSPGQKQPTTSAPLSEPQSQKPRFSVKVNDQIFKGFDSVTLNKRVVRVDGVTVGQAKMVIVLGQPLSMQADGGVSQGLSQAVLTSR